MSVDLNDSVEFLDSVECYRNCKAFHKSLGAIDSALRLNDEEQATKRAQMFHLLSCSLSEDRHTRGKALIEVAKQASERLAVLDRSFRRLVTVPLLELAEGDGERVQASKKRLETLRHPSDSPRAESMEGTIDGSAVLKAKQDFLEALDAVENKRRAITEDNLSAFLAEELRVLKEVVELLSKTVGSSKEPGAQKGDVAIKCQPCPDRSDQMCCVVFPAEGYEAMEEMSPPGLVMKRTKKISFIDRKPAELPPFSHGPADPSEEQLKQFCEECEEHCPPGAVFCKAVCGAAGCPSDIKLAAARVLGHEEGCIAKAIRQVERARGITRMEQENEEDEERGEERMVGGKLHGGSGKRERVPSISIHPPEEEGQAASEVVPSAVSNVSASSVSSPAISPDSDTSPYAADGPAVQIDREGEKDKTGDASESSSSKPKLGRYLTQPFPPPLLRQKARMPLPLPLSDEEEAELLRKNEASGAEGVGSHAPKTSGDSESANGKGEEDTTGLGKLNGGSGKGKGGPAAQQGSEGQSAQSNTTVKPMEAPTHSEAGSRPSVPEPTETPPPLDRVNEMVSEPRGPPFSDYPQKKSSAPGASSGSSSAAPSSTTGPAVPPSAASASTTNNASAEQEESEEASMKGGQLRGGSGKGQTASEGHSTAPSKNVPASHSSALLNPVKSVIQGLTKAEETAAEALCGMEERVVNAVSELVETGELTSTDHDARQEKESARQEERVKTADELTKHPWPQGSDSQRK